MTRARDIADLAGGGTLLTRQLFTATAGQTTFIPSAGYNPGALEVFMNGLMLLASDYTATNSSTVVLGVAANAGDEVEILTYQINTIGDTVSASNGGTISSPITVNRNTTDGNIISLTKEGTTIGSIGVDQYDNYLVSSNRELLLSTDRTVARSYVLGDGGSSNGVFYPATDNDADFGNSSKRWKDLYLSGGVYLGGTGSANKMDDYEEGTWTPRIVGSSSESGQSYQRQTGHYTKIGNQVFCRFILNFSSRGTFSGDYILDGFPFNFEAPADIHLCNLYHSYVGQNVISVGLYNRPNDNKAYIWIKTQAGQSREYPNSSFLTNDTELSGSFTLQTTA